MGLLPSRNRMKQAVENSGMTSLSRRERAVLAGGLVFVLCFLLYQLAIMPFFAARSNLLHAIERKKQELVQMTELQQQYRLQKKAEGEMFARISARSPGFTLFTFLDRQAEKAGIKKQISSITPSSSEGEGGLRENAVEVKLQLVSLESLVNFLLLVESEQDVVFLRRISIQENGKGQGSLDATLQLITYEKKA